MPPSKTYVQFGCGFHAPSEWLNFDASPTLRFERLPVIGKLYTKNAQRYPANVKYGDIVIGLPMGAGTVDAIFSNHVLEHIAYADCLIAISNCFSLLKSGGIFRAVLPDLHTIAESYLKMYGSAARDASHGFMIQSGLGVSRSPKNLLQQVKAFLGHERHLWLWDEFSMKSALEAVGFQNVRRCQFGDSADGMFALIESEGHYENAMGLECSKP